MHASTEEVEKELLELWSAVSKEKTAVEERRNVHEDVRQTHVAPIGEAEVTIGGTVNRLFEDSRSASEHC